MEPPILEKGFTKMSLKKKRILLLVDGDMVAFSHAAAEEYGKEPEEVNFGKIVSSMDAKMKYMSDRLQATDTICLISGDTNMRHTLFPAYKANRDGVWRPDNLKNAKAHLIMHWEGLKMDGLEADDLCAMLSRFKYDMKMGKRGLIKSLEFQGIRDDYDEVYVASLDKDLAQIGNSNPTGNGAKIFHYRWETQTSGEKITQVSGLGELKVIIKTSAKGDQKKEVKGSGAIFFLWQCLTGDGTDGIIGCGIRETKIYKSGAKCGQEYQKRNGVGALAAYELLANIKSYAEGLGIVQNQYILRFGDGWAENLLTNGRLLYMANMVDEGNKVRMWHYNPRIVDRFDLGTKQLIEHVG